MAERSFVKNAADPKQVKEGKLKEKFAREAELNDLLFVLSDIRGRRFIWKQLTGIHEISFIHGAPDSTAFNEGNRNKANKLLIEIMDAKPEAFVQMYRESKSGEPKEEEPKELEENA